MSRTPRILARAASSSALANPTRRTSVTNEIAAQTAGNQNRRQTQKTLRRCPVLGEQIGELTGRVTGTRMIPGGDYRYVKMEVSIQHSGQLYGVQATDYATYTVF